MKKNIMLYSSIAFSCIAVLVVAKPTNVAAENATSDATIKAIAGTDPVKPVDPKDPTKPGTNPPGEGNETGQTGSLQINYVPNLNFGTQVKITPGTVTTNLKNTATPYVQVSDLRGTGAGWTLNVSLGNFTSASGKTIAGAAIAYTGGEAVTNNQTTDNPAVSNDVTLNAGTTAAQSIMKATAGNGRGTWLSRYTLEENATENSKIVFSAPSDKIDANTDYTAVMTWQLADTPSNG